MRMFLSGFCLLVLCLTPSFLFLNLHVGEVSVTHLLKVSLVASTDD